MNEKERDTPTASGNVMCGGDAKKAHNYTTQKNIKHSAEVVSMKADVYQHLSPLSRKFADFFISENMMQIIEEEAVE